MGFKAGEKLREKDDRKTGDRKRTATNMAEKSKEIKYFYNYDL